MSSDWDIPPRPAPDGQATSLPPKVRFVDEWRRVLKRSWAVRFNLIDAAFTGIAAGFYVFGDSLPHGLFFGVSIFLSMASILARILWQPDFHPTEGE